MPPDQLGPNQLGSIPGVIVATTIIVETLKKLFGHKRFFKKVPIFVYVVVVSLILTTFANLVLHSLEGHLAALLWDTFYSALAASGFYSWLQSAAPEPKKRSHSEHSEPVATSSSSSG